MTISIRWRIGLAVAALAALLVWRLRPRALDVETVTVQAGPLRETIDEDGETRVRERYVVAAPITGRLSRIRLRAGDSVRQGELVGWVEPAPLDARTRQQASAQVEAAEDARHAALAAASAAQAALEQAVRARARAESLAVQGHLPAAQLEETQLLETTRRREFEAAGARAESAGHDLERARATLLAATGEEPCPQCGRMALRAPASGRVLRLLEESERVVAAGTPILVVGDPGRLEIVSDLLSTDAVNVRPGDTVLVEEWGGARPLLARLRLVEPSGFTKVSALGVEEQRVNVIADFVDPPGALADGYRVEVRVVRWGASAVLKLPLSALVRQEDAWTVFAVAGGRARARVVELGHRGAFEAEVTRGVAAGDEVIRYPSALIRDGVRVRAAGP